MKTKLFLIVCVVCAVLFSGDTFADKGDIYYIKPLQCKVYKFDNESEVKFIMLTGRRVVEYQRRNGFVHVGIFRSGNRVGWVKESALTFIPPVEYLE